MRGALSNTKKLVKGNAKCETVLSATQYPGSGSYIDVSGYETVDIVISLGSLGQAVTWEVKQTDGVSGAVLHTIDATYCKHAVVAATDDGQMISFHIETDQLLLDHHFITVDVSAAAAGDYADIIFYLGGARDLPITQTAALLPAASQHIHAG